MKQIRIGVVGVGALGRHHARILSSSPSVNLVGVADANLETAERIAEQYAVRAFTNYQALVSEVDAACIAVPTEAHFAVAAHFIRNGVSVLVEKPLAASLDQARELCRLAKTHNVVLQVGHVERFNPAAQALAERCSEPKYIRAERLSPFSFRSTDIGVVHDLMIHDIDLVLNLVGSPVRSVQSFGVSVMGGKEDCAQARLIFENGCIADLTASRINPLAQRTIQAWSAKGCVAADLTTREVVEYSPSEATLYGLSPTERSRQAGADIEQLKKDVFGKFIRVARPKVSAADALTAELEEFAGCVAHGNTPTVGGNEAVAALSVASAILESIANHQWDGCPGGAIGPNILVQSPLRKAG